MNLNLIICKIINVDYKDFSYLVNERGVRPVKAAIRLGASPEIAQIFAGLKLATTAEEITAVYKNDAVKSCMTGKDVDPFYVEMTARQLLILFFLFLVQRQNFMYLIP